MHKYMKVFEAVYYILLVVSLFSLIIPNHFISREAFILVTGIDFIGLGVLGLYKKAILLTRAQPLKYSEESRVGKGINVIFLVVGVIILIIGIGVLISGVHFTSHYKG